MTVGEHGQRIAIGFASMFLTEIFGRFGRSAELFLSFVVGIAVGLAAFAHGIEDGIGIVLFGGI